MIWLPGKSLATNRHITSTTGTASITDLFRRASKLGVDCEVVYHPIFTIWVTKNEGPQRLKASPNHMESA